MPLTKEERAQRAKQRELEREKEEREQSRKYPPAILDRSQDHSEWIQVLLDFRNPNFLRVRWTGDVFSDDLPFIGVKVASIPLDNLAQLAAMIRGLVMRYNAMVQDLNKEIGATPPMEAAKTFKPDGDPALLSPEERAKSTLIDDLDLSIRTANSVKRMTPHVRTVGDLIWRTEAQILRTPTMGRRSLNELVVVLRNMNLSFAARQSQPAAASENGAATDSA